MVIEGPKGLVAAAEFYAKLLGIENIDFTLTIKRGKLGANALGLCSYSPENDEYEVELERRWYDGNPDIYELLAHEMVHIKQYVTGEMEDRYTNDGQDVDTYWQGEIYPDTNYLDAPWEIEAYGKQVGMHFRWCNKGE